ncbi:MAG: tetratricopeptide repeat protein, partial [Planctomycetota bacterium]
SVVSARQSATAELRAGRFASALGFLDGAVNAAKQTSQLGDLARQLSAERRQVAAVVEYRRLAEQSEELAFLQHDAEAKAMLYRALQAVGVFRQGDWWNHLPSDVLTEPQLDFLRRNVYRKLILLAAAHAKDSLKDLNDSQSEQEARDVLSVNRLVQRFRPSEATRWHAAAARARLGLGSPLGSDDLQPPQNAADAYMLAALWVIAAQNPVVADLFAPGDKLPFMSAKRQLSVVDALAPDDYWSRLLRAYIEMVEAGQPDESSPEQLRARFVEARQALGHCIALKPDNWLAYAERSGACRQEIESRRAAGLSSIPDPWESTGELRRLMIRDVTRARDVAPTRGEVYWYLAFALKTAGQIDAAVDQMLEAIELGARFDVETLPRLVDPEQQRALPEAIQIASKLLEENPNNAHYRLLKGASLLRLGRLDEALVELDVALARPNPPDRGWVARGWLRLEKNEPEAAQSDFRRALIAAPHHAAALLGAARAHEAQGELQNALSLYEDVEAHAKTDYQRAAGHLGRGRTLLQLDRLEESLEALTQARRIKPACELTTVQRIAQHSEARQFVTELEALTRRDSASDFIGAGDVEFPTAALLDGGFELGLGRYWNNDRDGGLAWRNVGLDDSVAYFTEDRPYRGDRCLHIARRVPELASTFGKTTQTIPIDPLVRYQAILWGRAKNAGVGAVRLVVAGKDDQPVIALSGGTYEWT